MNNFDHLYQNIAEKKARFFMVFFVVTIITYAVLFALDFYPEPKNDAETTNEAAITTIEPDVSTANLGSEDNEPQKEIATVAIDDVLPARITIPKSDTDVVILNPESLDMNDLDSALLNGVVRHPQSADFADKGNILIFGHSSYLPTVFNKNFQAFNGVQNLNWGDEINLFSEDGVPYTYRVNRVYTVKASETIIDNDRGKATLTIVTCDSFGSKDDRFIVEALLVEKNT